MSEINPDQVFERRTHVPSTKEYPLGLNLMVPAMMPFYEKGHFWTVALKFKREYIIVDDRMFEYFSKPEVEISDSGIQDYNQDAPCKCKECIAGRKEVRKGWKPNFKVDES